jgi:penicillin-binding protein 1A
VGFSPSVTCGTWIGFDDRQSLGAKETGAQAALPMWMDFMRAAIAGKENETFPTAGEPKKVLAVTPDAADAAQRVAKPEPEVDPDDPAAPSVPQASPPRQPITVPPA